MDSQKSEVSLMKFHPRKKYLAIFSWYHFSGFDYLPDIPE